MIEIVGRPEVIDKSNSTIDRAIRELVEQANRNGDCIINAGEGCFRPIPGNVVDEYYFYEYMAKEKSRLGEELRESMVVHVVSPNLVKLYSGLTKERKREQLFEAGASLPKFRYDEWYDQERFLIEMQACFEVNEDLATILKVAGNVEAKTTANYGDDGVSQKTTIKQGIASKADVLVPNPVTLVPYRTFLEVKQPDSEFVFRIRDNGGAPAFKIVEAEGGLWRNLAVISIKEYLMEALKDDPNYDRLTFIA